MNETLVAEAMKLIPPQTIAEAEAQMNSLPSFRAEYAARLASFAWQPIAAYEKTAAATVLLRSGGHACAGLWTAATIWTEPIVDEVGTPASVDFRPGEMWRSAEEAVLEMPLQFEPAEFAVLDAETLPGFIATLGGSRSLGVSMTKG